MLPLFGMTMSLDQTGIYAIGVGFPFTLVAVDPLDGSVTTLAEIGAGGELAESVGGSAVVPIPQPPIPSVSAWGLVVLTLLLLTVGTITARRVRLHARL